MKFEVEVTLKSAKDRDCLISQLIGLPSVKSVKAVVDEPAKITMVTETRRRPMTGPVRDMIDQAGFNCLEWKHL